MARPLPRILSKDSAQVARMQIARSRELARTAADSATDVLHPLITISRGLRRLALAGRAKWAATPKEKRGPLLFLAAAVIMAVALMPYGPLLAAVSLMVAAAWYGRDHAPAAPEGPDPAQTERLQSLYEALVPCFSIADDPAPMYAHGGEWDAVFAEHEFDEGGRLERIAIRYPAYFPDGDPETRTRVERLLTAKAGRGREYRFSWEEEGNRLTLSALAPCPPASPPSASSPRRARRCSASPTPTRSSAPSRSPTARSGATCLRWSGAPAAARRSPIC